MKSVFAVMVVLVSLFTGSVNSATMRVPSMPTATSLSKDEVRSSLLVELQLNDDTVKAHFHESAREQLQTSLNPVKTICVAGPARSGKSTLINLLTNTTKLFAVSHKAHQSDTVRVSNEFFPQSSEMRVRYVETESVGEHSAKYDSHMLLSVLPACDLILYNMKATGQRREGLAQLQPFIDTYSELAKDASNVRALADKPLFPPIALVLRDWVFQDDYSADDFLDANTNPQNAVVEANSDHAYMSLLDETFSSVNAALLPVPCGRGCLEKGRELVLSSTTPEFLAAFEGLKRTVTQVLSASNEGWITNPAGSSDMFLDRVKVLCEQIDEGHFSIPTALYAVRKQDYRRASDVALDHAARNNLAFPMSFVELQAAQHATRNDTMAFFNDMTAQWTNHSDFARERAAFALQLDAFVDKKQVRQALNSFLNDKLAAVEALWTQAIFQMASDEQQAKWRKDRMRETKKCISESIRGRCVGLGSQTGSLCMEEESSEP